MSTPYSGGCACGAIRYEIAAEPIASNDCQCRQCQQASGTGHGSYLTFLHAPVTLEGKAKLWNAVGEGGTVKSRGFCPECGAPVYMTFPAMPEVFVIHAGSLDDPSRYLPQIATWSASAQPWDRVDPALTRFAKMPASS